MWGRGLRCRRRGHQWFPDHQRREFIVVESWCIRCRTHDVLLPWGQCLTGHAMADHYDSSGHRVPVPGCAGPQ